MLSRVLGLVREQVIATLFSRTATDAFYVAFRIPNLLRDLFAEGAMSSAFVPTFTEQLAKHGPKEAWKLASNVLNLLAMALSLITLLGIYFSDWLVARLAGHFSSIPGKFELTVLLTQIMFPFLPLVALAAVVMGILNSQGSFFLPALAPALFNVGSLFVGVALYFWLADSGCDPIIGMAVGTLTGGSLQLLVQVPALLRRGFVYSFGAGFKHPGVQRILLLMGPGTLGLASTQINIFVNTWLATGQGEGAVSWLNYAFRLMQFPLGIFGVAIATAALPTVSSQVASRENTELRNTLASALKLVFVVNVPASVGLMVLSEPIVALIYQHGRFREPDTSATAGALVLYAIGLFAYSAVKVLVPAFYALGRSRIPVAISAVVVALNIILSLILVRLLGFRGLALGTSMAAIGNFWLLFLFLQKHVGALDAKGILVTLGKMTCASLVMGAACLEFHDWVFSRSATATVAWRLLTLTMSISVAVGVLVLACRILRVTELDAALSLARRRLRG